MYPRPLVVFPASSSRATWEATERSKPPYSFGILRLLKPAARAFARSAPSFSSSISPRSAISASNGWSSRLTNSAMRSLISLTSSGISGTMGCSRAVVNAPTSLLRKGKGDSVLWPARVVLPRKTVEVDLVPRQIADDPLGHELRHLLPERRSPHHPVTASRQHVEPLHRLVDDREV